jgi:hypothetical protein
METRHAGNILIGEVAEGELADGQAHGETEVGEAARTRGEVVVVLVNEAKRCKNEEEVALSDGGVDSKQQDDGRLDEYLSGMDPRAFEDGDELR